MDKKVKDSIIDSVLKRESSDFSLGAILKQNQDCVIAIGKKTFESKIIDFPTLRQTWTYSCGASAVQVMLLYYGIDKREGQIIKKVDTTEEGTERENIIAYFKSFGFKVEEDQNYTIDDLKEFVDKNLPVMIALQAWVDDPVVDGWEKGWDNGHYVVVTGYTDSHIIFSDPSSVYDTYLTYEEFEERWHDVGKTPDDKLVHYAMIPYGKVPNFHSNLFIHMD